MLETSEPIYASEFDAQMAGYERMKEKPSLFGPVPMTGGKVEGGLGYVTSAYCAIRAKEK